MKAKESLKPKGKVEIFVTKGSPTVTTGKLISNQNGFKIHDSAVIDFEKTEIIDQSVVYNIIVNQGKDQVINALVSGFINTVCRMAIGDRGTIPSNQTVPKVPVPTMTGLYNEVYRADVDVTTLNVGTPTVHQVQFVKTFTASVIPITSFSNQANPIINEVGLISANLLSGNPLPRAPVAAPASPLADEKLFSIRTFNSVPFEIANDIAITIRYTIFIE